MEWRDGIAPASGKSAGKMSCRDRLYLPWGSFLEDGLSTLLYLWRFFLPFEVDVSVLGFARCLMVREARGRRRRWFRSKMALECRGPPAVAARDAHWRQLALVAMLTSGV